MKFTQRLSVMALTVAVCLPASVLIAQMDNGDQQPPPPDDNGGGLDNGGNDGGFGRRPRGNFDPAQMQQRMLENIRTQLAFTNKTEWASVQPLVQKVMEARREAMAGGGGPGMGGRFGGGEGRSVARSEDRGGPGPGGFRQNPAAEALQKALEGKSSAQEIKAALEKYRAARAENESKLAAAQDNLRKVLSVRQEAQAVLLGLLP